MIKNKSLIDEIKVQLEWRMTEAIEKYPDLAIGEMLDVFEKFYQGREVLIHEGWYLIDSYVREIRYKRG